MAEYLTATNVFLAAAVYLAVCGAAGAYVSGQLGREGIEGFVLALLFGPLGVLIAACLPAIDRAKAGGEQEEKVDVVEEGLRAAVGWTMPSEPPPAPRAPRRLLGEVRE
jgi:hypothetical protein